MGCLFFAHVLINNDVGANQKAARHLWAAMQEKRLHPVFRYLLFVVICARPHVPILRPIKERVG